jgi:hypothetical protein
VTYGKKHLPLLPLSLQLRPGELGLRCSSPTHAVIVRPPLLLPEPRRHLARNRCSFPDSRANLAAITPPPLLIPQSDASLGRCGGPRSSSRSASAAPPRPTPQQFSLRCSSPSHAAISPKSLLLPRLTRQSRRNHSTSAAHSPTDASLGRCGGPQS